MARPPLALVSTHDAPDHIAAAIDHYAKALEHAREADREGRDALVQGAEHYAQLAKLPTLQPGIAEEYRQLSEAMSAALQRIVAVASKGAG